MRDEFVLISYALKIHKVLEKRMEAEVFIGVGEILDGLVC
jgi:hypothetical protein